MLIYYIEFKEQETQDNGEYRIPNKHQKIQNVLQLLA